MRLALLLAISMLSLLALVTVIPMRVNTEPTSEAPLQVRLSPRAQEEIRQVEARIDDIEAAALAELPAAPDPARRITLLGKLLLFDKDLSVNKHEASAFCHIPQTGVCSPLTALTIT